MYKSNVEVRLMKELNTDVRREVAQVFVDGYDRELSFLSKDEEKLVSAFQQMICPEVFYIGILDNEIVGILACSNNKQRAITIKQEVLKEHFGAWKGRIAYRFMKDEFNSKLLFGNEAGYIECVATKEKSRGKGVSTALFNDMLVHAPHQHYMLEVVDTNVAARKMYSKLGFIETKRKKERFSSLKGFKERIYMERYS
ncbi:GNAT family N-acetyltransferase [Oceanobacillus sp. ISL-73]|uniref:GNAT family N-acetyltransferase n=1 Tax=Oceanobacillus TaxID=182709 RepID=UPI001BE6BD51|nr:GNAT family N-acetyltransferase [Oceanobacillus sp. ISL-73]MBT2653132.1 GNAT family N-acetyltransferase [Oceanobacillus sp. ISL-73]